MAEQLTVHDADAARDSLARYATALQTLGQLQRDLAAARVENKEFRSLLGMNWDDPSRSDSYVFPTYVLQQMRKVVKRD